MLKFTKVLSVLLAVHRGLCRQGRGLYLHARYHLVSSDTIHLISTPATLCHSFRFSQFPPLHFAVVVSFLAISTPAFLTVPLFHVSHFQSIPAAEHLLWPPCVADADIIGLFLPCGTQLPTERGTAVPHFSTHVYCAQTVAKNGPSQKLLSSCYHFCRHVRCSCKPNFI